MKQEQIKYYSIVDVIIKAIEGLTEPDPKMKEKTLGLNVISDLTYSNIWNSFAKWCTEQAELGYLINIFSFGNMFFVSLKNFEGIILKLSDFFLKEFNLTWEETNNSFAKHFQTKFTTQQPQVQKLNYIAISTELNLPKVLIQNGLNSLFHSLGVLLTSDMNTQVDLGSLGLLICQNKTIFHSPNKIKIDNTMNKRTTIRALIIRTTMPTDENLRENQKEKDISPTQKCQTEAYDTTWTVNSFNKNIVINKDKNKKIKTLPPVKSKKNDRLIAIPMPDPSWDLKDMLSLTFIHKFVPKAKANPIIFNVYSNTKAAPFTAEKTQIPISHRIASFYSLPLQNFIIDKTTKNIKRLSDDYFLKYKLITFDQPATELEEYLFLLNYENISEDKIKLKKETYQKYLAFIDTAVNNEYLADIKEQWLKEIAKMSHRAYSIPNIDKYDSMLNNCMSEIISDYKFSMKKSILDYILKHPEQREKLGIPVPFRKLKEYGEENITRPSDNDAEWKSEWNKNKLSISNNLYIMCENVTKILNYYVKSLKGTSYIDLKENETWPTLKLTNFSENQKAKLELEKKIVNDDWRKYVENILKENKIYKDQLILYFKSVSGLMSSQLRKLIIGSIETYYNYINQFKKDKYYSPLEIFNDQYSNDFPFQKSFLEIDIKESENKIHYNFSEDMNDIHLKLTNVVKDIIKYSQNVERPDNMFIKNIEKRSNLWQVPFRDSEVTKMYNEIDSIINQNLEVITKVTDLYEPFEFVMKEKESIEAFLLTYPKREDFKKLIDLYEQKLVLMIEKMPDTLYMNMIKINCNEINKSIREKLTEFINELLKSIFNVNIVLKSKKLGEECEKLFNKFQSPIPNEEALFNLENDLELCKMETVPQLQNDYEDFLEWVFFYLSYDTYKVFDPSKETGNAFEQYIKTRHDNFISIEISMKTFIEALENSKKAFTAALDEERIKVIGRITELVKDVEFKRTNINSEILNDDFDNYLKDLLEYQKEAFDCKRCLSEVIKKEGFLGNPFTTEDERLDTCIKDLEPIINYFSFIKAYKEEKKNLMEVPLTIIKFKDINALIEQDNIFDVSLHKISAYKPKIQKAKDEFTNFKHGIEMAKTFFPLCEQFIYINVEETDIYKDNRYYCSEVAKLYPKYLQKDTPENTQNLFKNLRLQSIIYLASKTEDAKTEGGLGQKNDFPYQEKLEKIVNEWVNVSEMYKLQGEMADAINIEFQTEKYNNKEYLIIKNENFTTIKNTLKRNIEAAEEKLILFDSPRPEIIIVQTMIDFKNKLSDLWKILIDLEAKQLKLEEYMDKTIEIKKKQESFQMLKQAENEYRVLMEMISEKKPKILGILRVKDDFLDVIRNVDKLLSNIEKELASRVAS